MEATNLGEDLFHEQDLERVFKPVRPFEANAEVKAPKPTVTVIM